jgi:hypothetical protein
MTRDSIVHLPFHVLRAVGLIGQTFSCSETTYHPNYASVIIDKVIHALQTQLLGTYRTYILLHDC